MNKQLLFAIVVISIAMIGSSSAGPMFKYNDGGAQDDALQRSRAGIRCAININQDLGDPQPLYILPRSSDFLLPRTSAGIIRINRNANIELHCSHGFQAPLSGQSIIATCLGGTNFLVNGDEIEFSDITCNELPAHTARPTNRTCPGGEIAQVGYHVENRWLNLMDICHDPVVAVTHWVHHFQDPWNRGFQRGFPRIMFIQGDFFDTLNVHALYTRGRQRRTIANILGSEQLAQDLIEEVGDLFLSRGHLAARTDYMLGSHQQASFYYLNAAPQWQTFNGGNWERVETGLRNHVDRQNWNVELFTGTHGILTIDDVNGRPQELFLHMQRGRGRIPVPKIYYKIAIEHNLKAGIVFIGVNHPYATLEQIKSDFVYCDDVSDKVTYIPWQKDNIKLGYSYACAVSEFAKRIPELPPLPHVDRLLI